MMPGTITSWDHGLNRGTITSRLGQTYPFERKDVVDSGIKLEPGKVLNQDVAFEVIDGLNEAYAVESLTGQFVRFAEVTEVD